MVHIVKNISSVLLLFLAADIVTFNIVRLKTAHSSYSLSAVTMLPAIAEAATVAADARYTNESL